MQSLLEIGVTATLWTLILGNSVAVALGLLALCAPTLLQRFDQWGNLWISSRRAGRPLEVNIDSDGVVLRRPVVSGGLLIAGSALVLVQGGAFFLDTSPAAGAALLSGLFSPGAFTQSFWEIAWLSGAAIILLGALLGLVLGCLVLIRSDLLARLNASASRSYSTRSWLKPVETPHRELEENLLRHPRLWGAVVVLFGVYVLIALIAYVRVSH
jgi:hypothetical protein